MINIQEQQIKAVLRLSLFSETASDYAHMYSRLEDNAIIVFWKAFELEEDAMLSDEEPVGSQISIEGNTYNSEIIKIDKMGFFHKASQY